MIEMYNIWGLYYTFQSLSNCTRKITLIYLQLYDSSLAEVREDPQTSVGLRRTQVLIYSGDLVYHKKTLTFNFRKQEGGLMGRFYEPICPGKGIN